MHIIISPAKTLDFETPSKANKHSQTEFLARSAKLIGELRQLAPQDISALMKVSDKIGQLNYDRFQSWKRPFTEKNAKQALLAFKGDVYTGLDAESFTQHDFNWAQKHLRILSGLYGLLKPLDLIQPYRLEMGTKFANQGGKNLYEFWGDALTDALNQELASEKKPVLINLASNEYFKAVNTKSLNAEIITPAFKDFKNGQYKMISFYAKKARGLMSAYIIKNRLKNPEEIKGFDTAGYYYSPEQSKGNTWVFLRDEPQ
ncbi:peroxide stress protein YaaA [Porticoccus sp. W117]|uniref:peroxide stress protein YaaA n=1 Tax=Porticoccus sp. W117 TaxID=3054777 RepID=UPI00259704C1|nr:peroxide stress protein YaaA [Porticoccus sp. W117]MDM3870426.1 peroxide stress protein YaaA [Porticoccus sp. W117]